MEINLPYRQVFHFPTKSNENLLCLHKELLVGIVLVSLFFFQGPDKFCDFPSLFFPPKTALCNFLAR